MIKKVWGDPVWSKVIAYGIIGLITYISVSTEVIADFLFSLFEASIEFLFDETAVQNYWLFILAAFGLMGACLIGTLLYVRFFEKDPPKPAWLKYTEDVFHSLLWRWRYSESGDIANLHTLCPKCHFQVLPIFKDNWPKGTQLIYRCESCGFEAPPIEGDYDIVENRITRFIQQNLRTGKWQEE